MASGNLGPGTSTHELYIPLQFWFCRNPGLALPLIALQYHEVKVILNTTSKTNLANTTSDLYADYIYLDTDERKRFAQVSHEYLIEQSIKLNSSNKNTITLIVGSLYLVGEILNLN